MATVTFPGFAAGVDQEEVELIWHKTDAVPMISLTARMKGGDRFSRYILCKPSADPGNAPVFDLGRRLTFAPDFINLSVNLSGSLYSPGSSTEVHAEIGTQGVGENAFLGIDQSIVPPSGYVEAEFKLRDAHTGRALTYLATLRGRC